MYNGRFTHRTISHENLLVQKRQTAQHADRNVQRLNYGQLVVLQK